jgi:hypothetical protein
MTLDIPQAQSFQTLITAACAISPKVVKTSSLTLSSPASLQKKLGGATVRCLLWLKKAAWARSFVEAIDQWLRKLGVDLI